MVVFEVVKAKGWCFEMIKLGLNFGNLLWKTVLM
jgi:hypothetical protein